MVWHSVIHTPKVKCTITPIWCVFVLVWHELTDTIVDLQKVPSKCHLWSFRCNLIDVCFWWLKWIVLHPTSHHWVCASRICSGCRRTPTTNSSCSPLILRCLPVHGQAKMKWSLPSQACCRMRYHITLGLGRNSGCRFCIMVWLKFWADCYMPYYTHCQELKKSVGSHGTSSLLFVMKMMVCSLVSNCS
jgi:hypothetical protein